jgi:hypothetical protein
MDLQYVSCNIFLAFFKNYYALLTKKGEMTLGQYNAKA